MEKDKIIEICRKEKVNGVVSTGSEITTEIACYIANKLGFNCNNYEKLINFRNKYNGLNNSGINRYHFIYTDTILWKYRYKKDKICT